MASERHRGDVPPVDGVSAEFATPQALLAAVRALGPRDFGRLETHTPVPVAGLAAALGTSGSLRAYAAGGVALGGLGTLALCVYATAYAYVFNIGGRPTLSWPAYVVPSVSAATLLGALGTMAGLLFTLRLPRLNHPFFNSPSATRASQDRFIVVIVQAEDAALDLPAVRAALTALAERPLAVALVPR